MSLASDCPGCCVGDHDKHDADYGIVPGLIGGTYCDCKGDCGERLPCFTVDAAARDHYFPPIAPRPDSSSSSRIFGSL